MIQRREEKIEESPDGIAVRSRDSFLCQHGLLTSFFPIGAITYAKIVFNIPSTIYKLMQIENSISIPYLLYQCLLP